MERKFKLKPQYLARDLIGAPTNIFVIGDHNDLFEILMGAYTQNFIVTANCGSKNIPEKSKEEYKSLTLDKDFYYTITNVAEVTDSKGNL